MGVHFHGQLRIEGQQLCPFHQLFHNLIANLEEENKFYLMENF
jgi:hypothetical protein